MTRDIRWHSERSIQTLKSKLVVEGRPSLFWSWVSRPSRLSLIDEGPQFVLALESDRSSDLSTLPFVPPGMPNVIRVEFAQLINLPDVQAYSAI